MNKKILITTIIATSILLGVFIIRIMTGDNTLGASLSYVDTIRTTTATSSSIGIYATSSVLAVQPTRKTAYFSNTGSGVIYVCMQATCTTTTGILLAAGSTSRLIDGNFPYIGAITAIATTATSTLVVIYK